MREGTAAAETKDYGRDAGLLTIALGTAGLLTYIYFALASHNLSRDEYGEIVVLWSAVYVTVATLFRPIEQLLARSLAELGGRAAGRRRVIRGAFVIQLVIAAVAIAVALVPNGPIEDELLGNDGTLFAIFLAALVAFGASFFARGYLAGRRRFAVYGGLLSVEGMARAGFALVVALGIADGRDAIAIGVAAGPLISLLVVPLAFRARAAPEATDVPADSDSSGGGLSQSSEPEFTLSAGWGFAGAVVLVMLSEQVILNTGPLLVRASEGAAEAGFIFNVLLVARAPLVLFQAVAASLLPHLTRLQSRGDETGEEAFRLSVRATATAIAGFAAAVVLGVLAVGPDVMQLAFGEKFEYDRLGLALVAVGMGFYLCAQTLSQAALAQGQVRRAAACWAGSAIVFVGVNLIPALDIFRRVEVGFAATAIILCGLLYLLYREPHPRHEDLVEPGSAKEVEAQLAATEESL